MLIAVTVSRIHGICRVAKERRAKRHCKTSEGSKRSTSRLPGHRLPSACDHILLSARLGRLGTWAACLLHGLTKMKQEYYKLWSPSVSLRVNRTRHYCKRKLHMRHDTVRTICSRMYTHTDDVILDFRQKTPALLVHCWVTWHLAND